MTGGTISWEVPWMSLPPREAWIEIAYPFGSKLFIRRFPRGKRGLKYKLLKTHPSNSCRFPRGKRGLKWFVAALYDFYPGRFPRGKRGLKYSSGFCCPGSRRRFPRGKRGLK